MRVADVEDTGSQPVAGTASSWCWRYAGASAAEALWKELADWLGWVRHRYPLARRIPECWADHPEVVEELTARGSPGRRRTSNATPPSRPPPNGTTDGCRAYSTASSTGPSPSTAAPATQVALRLYIQMPKPVRQRHLVSQGRDYDGAQIQGPPVARPFLADCWALVRSAAIGSPAQPSPHSWIIEFAPGLTQALFRSLLAGSTAPAVGRRCPDPRRPKLTRSRQSSGMMSGNEWRSSSRPW